MDASVTCARSFSAYICASACLRSVMSVTEPAMRTAQPGGVAHRAAARPEPAVLAGLAAAAELDVERRVVAQVRGGRGARRIAVVGMQQRDEAHRGVVHLLLGVADQFVAARREIEFAGEHVPVPQAVVAAGDREVEALVADAQRVLQRRCSAAACRRDRKMPSSTSSSGDDQRDDLQQQLGLARRLAQRCGERVLERRQPRVDGVDLVERRPQRRRCRVHRAWTCACRRMRRVLERCDFAVGLGPDADRALDVVHVPEAPEQQDHAVDVVGIVAARRGSPGARRRSWAPAGPVPRARGGRPAARRWRSGSAGSRPRTASARSG